MKELKTEAKIYLLATKTTGTWEKLWIHADEINCKHYLPTGVVPIPMLVQVGTYIHNYCHYRKF